ncbi:MAG: T9SS type A sorting domain-containing protein [Melioribacteraceae bacterium]|nr:T9SS type A sorting domain-containing protein [Melioribacteraceae bacterium]MCF8263397.1 T9SS type A sorting domain-containing protein [Melioribacteraceae bacterium]MCF8414207.1 T9SS type A sorting domain-containing protein [Melioribacteraceae bacterium]MCF8430883.1 T9SS type A sorting domain-containing protein [Melioribacteraceae bacterium]
MLEIKVKNEGDDSPAGFNNISVSFPEFSNSSDMHNVGDASGTSSDLEYHEYIGGGLGGDGYAEYVVIEANDNDGWDGGSIWGETNTLVLSITPKRFGEFPILFRTAGSTQESWQDGWTYNPTSGFTDPLGFEAYKITLDIIQTEVPNEIDVTFYVKYENVPIVGSLLFNSPKYEIQEGQGLYIPDINLSYSLPFSTIGFNAITGSLLTFGDIANQDLIVEVYYIYNFSSGIPFIRFNEDLFLEMEVKVYNKNTNQLFTNQFDFNDNEHVVFSVNKASGFLEYLEAIDMTEDNLAFAYLNNLGYSTDGIETVNLGDRIYFIADHFSKFAGGRGKLSSLPVELSKFTAEYLTSQVVLNCQTATEVNNYGFEVERRKLEFSSQNSEWIRVGFVEGHGTTNSPKSYSFTDVDIPNVEKVSYRLKQIDFDGKYEYSQTVDVFIEFPEEYSLSQNFPNPFNPITTIRVALPKESHVVLNIYNILGEKVKTLANELMPAGYSNFIFDASNLNSGMYIYRVEAGDFVEVKKMILLR